MMAFAHLSRRLWLPCAARDIEPDRDGCIGADMGPSDGPVLGPFKSRSEALGAERGWLADIHFDDSSAAAGIPAATCVATPLGSSWKICTTVPLVNA